MKLELTLALRIMRHVGSAPTDARNGPAGILSLGTHWIRGKRGVHAAEHDVSRNQTSTKTPTLARIENRS